MSEKKSPLEIIKQIGRWNLSSSDGSCICGSFEVGGLHVDMSCHKPQAWDPRYKLAWNGPLIRVYGNADVAKDLEAVALYVAQDIIENSYKYDRIGIRYCESRHDVPEPNCTYCGKPRADVEGYLCENCKAGVNASERVPTKSDYSKLTHFYGDETVTGMGVVCITLDLKGKQ